MTWEELAVKIVEMPQEQRLQTVRFVEPYDRGSVWQPDLYFAAEAIEDNWGDDAKVPTIQVGKPYLF